MSSQAGSLAFAAVYVLALTISAVVAAHAWRHRATTYAASGLTWIMIAMAVWSAGELLMVLAQSDWISDEVARIGVTPAVPMGAIAAAGLWVMSTALADRTWRPSGRTLALLLLHPGFMVAVAVTDPWTELINRDVHIDADTRRLDWSVGPVFWPHVTVSYSIVLWGLLTLVRAWPHMGRLHRQQASTVLFGTALPLITNMTMVLGWVPWLPVDLTPVSFAASGLIAIRGMTRRGLLRLVPVARGLVFERLRDAVIVIDPTGLVLDVNPAARKLIHQLAPALTGAVTATPSQALLRQIGVSAGVTDGLYPVDLPNGRVVFDVDVEPLIDARARTVGQVVVVRDVTELDQLRLRLADQALRDELTGLHNRRHLLIELERELDVARSTGGDLSLMMLDVDHFKSVNDRHGHSVGDALLVGIGQALATKLRTADILTRYGGEEFVVLLPGATRDQGMARAEELRHACAQIAVPGATGPVNRTISIGVASLGEVTAVQDVSMATVLLQAADRALYAAKGAGRNTVMAATRI